MSLGVETGDRIEDLRWSYVIWQEGVSPFLVVELLSPGTEDEDLGQNVRELGKPPTKWEVYERILRVPFYVVFDRYGQTLRVFQLFGDRYTAASLNEGRFWLDELQLGLGVWQGRYQDIEGQWLRWYDADGAWIPTQRERGQLAEQQAQAEAEARRSAIPRLAKMGLTVVQIAEALDLPLAAVEQQLVG